MVKGCGESWPGRVWRDRYESEVDAEMPLEIAGKSFVVKTASLGGTLFHKSWKKWDPTIGKGVQYSLTIECDSQQVDIEGQEKQWRPSLSFDRFSLPAKSWTDIESCDVKKFEGSCFLDFHDDAVATLISFRDRTASRFAAHLEGRCARFDFVFDGPVTFDGYRVVGTFRDTEESLTAMLAKHLDLTGLVGEESTLDESIPRRKMRSKNFTPSSAD